MLFICGPPCYLTLYSWFMGRPVYVNVCVCVFPPLEYSHFLISSEPCSSGTLGGHSSAGMGIPKEIQQQEWLNTKELLFFSAYYRLHPIQSLQPCEGTERIIRIKLITSVCIHLGCPLIFSSTPIHPSTHLKGLFRPQTN